MSPRLPTISPKDAVVAFCRSGYVVVGQRGSHVRLQNAAGVVLIIPVHHGDIKRPLLKALIKDAGMSEGEFRNFI